MADEKMVERTVLVDGYANVQPTGEPGKFQTLLATRGEKVMVTEARAKIGEELGHLGDEAAAEQRQALREAAESGTTVTAINDAGEPMSDDELAKMNAKDLIAFIGQNPGELDRVEDLESNRGEQARTTVMDAIDAARAKLDEIEAQGE